MKNKWIKYSIALILLAGGLILSLLCLSETNVTSLLVYHDKSVYRVRPAGPLVANQANHGEFLATNNNLGMVKLRIKTYNRINTTHIRFQLREKGATSWLVSNQYTIDRFPDGLLYPFGFPVISDSKGKIYEFTLESIDGTPGNAIGIEEGYHDVATQYVYSRHLLTTTFLSEKIKSLLTDPYMLVYVSIFIIPSIIFFAKRYGEVLGVYVVLVYTYLPIAMHSNTILYIAGLLTAICCFLRIPSSRIYLLGLFMLIQISMLLTVDYVTPAERAATFVFFSILIGGIISLCHKP